MSIYPLSLMARLVGPLIRFFVHLVIILRALGRSVPEEAANGIIQAYLGVLEMEGDDRLVAMYAACLREGNGEESYARYLYGERQGRIGPHSPALDPDATKEARAEALMRAKQNNLDTAVIVRETVRMVLEEAFSVCHLKQDSVSLIG